MMVEQLSQVKKHIIERDRFLIDFDKARHDLASELKKAETAPGSPSMAVVQKRHDERQEAYLRRNEEVLNEMNDVYRNRNIFTELQMVCPSSCSSILPSRSFLHLISYVISSQLIPSLSLILLNLSHLSGFTFSASLLLPVLNSFSFFISLSTLPLLLNSLPQQVLNSLNLPPNSQAFLHPELYQSPLPLPLNPTVLLPLPLTLQLRVLLLQVTHFHPNNNNNNNNNHNNHNNHNNNNNIVLLLLLFPLLLLLLLHSLLEEVEQSQETLPRREQRHSTPSEEKHQQS
jgi:hypothetical protein